MSHYSDSIYSADERGDTFGDSYVLQSPPMHYGQSNTAALVDVSDSNNSATMTSGLHQSNDETSIAYHSGSTHVSSNSQQSNHTHQPYGSQRSYSGQRSYVSQYSDSGIRGARQSDSAYHSGSTVTAAHYSTPAHTAPTVLSAPSAPTVPSANLFPQGPALIPVVPQPPAAIPAPSNPFGTYEGPFDRSKIPGPGLGELSAIREAAEQVVASIMADKTSGKMMSKFKQKLFFQCPEFVGLMKDVVEKGEQTALGARLDGSHFENIEKFRLHAAFKSTMEALLHMMTAVEVMIGKQILASHLRKVLLLRLGKMHWVMEGLAKGLEPLLGGRDWRYDAILKKIKACREILRVQNGGEQIVE